MTLETTAKADFYKRIATPNSIASLNRLLGSRLIRTIANSATHILAESEGDDSKIKKYFWYSIYGSTCLGSGLLLAVVSLGSYVIVNTASLVTFRYIKPQNFEFTVIWRILRHAGKEENLSMPEMFKMLALEVASHPDVFRIIGQLDSGSILAAAKAFRLPIVGEDNTIIPQIQTVLDAILKEVSNENLKPIIKSLKDIMDEISKSKELPEDIIKSSAPKILLASIPLIRAILSPEKLQQDLDSLIKNPILKSTALDFYKGYLIKSYFEGLKQPLPKEDRALLSEFTVIYGSLPDDKKIEIESKAIAVGQAIDGLLSSDILPQILGLLNTVANKTWIYQWKNLVKAYNRDEKAGDYTAQLIQAAIPIVQVLANDKIIGHIGNIIKNESIENLLKALVGIENELFKLFKCLQSNTDELLAITQNILKAGDLDDIIILIMHTIPKAADSKPSLPEDPDPLKDLLQNPSIQQPTIIKLIFGLLSEEQKEDIKSRLPDVSLAIDGLLVSKVTAQVLRLASIIINEIDIEKRQALIEAYQQGNIMLLIKAAIPVIQVLTDDAIIESLKNIIKDESIENLLKAVLGAESDLFKQFKWLKTNLDEILNLTKDLLKADLDGIVDMFIMYQYIPQRPEAQRKDFDIEFLQAFFKEHGQGDNGLLAIIKKHSKAITTLANTFPSYPGLIVSFDSELIDTALDVVTRSTLDNVIMGELIDLYNKDEVDVDKIIELTAHVLNKEAAQKAINIAMLGLKSTDENTSARIKLARDLFASDAFHPSLQSLLKAIPLIKTELPALHESIEKTGAELRDMLSKSELLTPEIKNKSDELNRLQAEREVLARRCNLHFEDFVSSFVKVITGLEKQGKLMEHADTLEWLIDTMLFGELLGEDVSQKMLDYTGFTPKDLTHQIMENPGVLNVIPTALNAALLMKQAQIKDKAVAVASALPSSLYHTKNLVSGLVSNVTSKSQQNLAHILDDAQKQYKEPDKVDLGNKITIGKNKTDFGNQTYFRLKFINCKVAELNDGMGLSIAGSTIKSLSFSNTEISKLDASNCTITQLTIKNSDLKHCNFSNIKAQHLVLDNVTFDAETFVSLMRAIRNNKDIQSVSLKNIKGPIGIDKNELPEIMSVIPDITKFSKDNPDFPNLKDLYTVDAALKSLTTAKDGAVMALKGFIRNAIKDLDAEALKKLIYAKDEVVGVEGGKYWGETTGLTQFMSEERIENPSLYNTISLFIKDKVREISIDKKALKQEMKAMLEHEDLEEKDLKELKKLVSKIVENVDDKYISLLSKKSQEIVGHREYSYFSGYYYTGILSIAHEISYIKPEVLEKEIKQIFMEQLGATTNIFNEEMEQPTKDR